MVISLFFVVAAGTVFAQAITYEFKPPQNNFYCRWKDYDGVTHFHGYIKGGLWSGNSEGEEYFSASPGSSYVKNDGKWYLDDMIDSSDIGEWIADHLKEPEMLGNYYTNFWKQYNAAAGGTLKADLYHKGQEKFLGINCDIFIDNMMRKYWIDPSNGCTLKITDSGGKVGYEVLEYNLNFSNWPAGLPPR